MSELHDIHATAYLCHHPQALEHFKLDYIERLNYREIVEHILALKTSQPVPKVVLMGDLKAGLFGSIERVYKYYEDNLSKIEPTKRKDEFNQLVTLMKTRLKRREFSDVLRIAADRAEAGDMRGANDLIWKLHYDEAQDLDMTFNVCQEALQDDSSFKTGIAQIDNNMGGLCKGNLMSISGDSGTMKTMISLWIVLQILKANPTFKAVYFEKEMPIKEIGRRLISQLLHIPQKTLMFASVERQEEVANELLNKASEDKFIMEILTNRLILVPNNRFETAADMVEIIKHYNADIWCLDFLTMLGEDTSKDMYTFIKEQMGIFKQTVIQTDSLGIILGQLKQSAIEGRANKIPLRQDIEYSSKMKQYSAYIYTTFFPSLYYDIDSVPASYYYLVNQKDRHGKPSDLYFEAIPEMCSFAEPDYDIADMKEWLSAYRRQYK